MTHKELKRPLSNLNHVILAGVIVSDVLQHPGDRLVFTLQNERGRFFVRWTDPQWQPQRGDQVLVRGALFSVANHHGHSARVDAAEIKSLMGD